MERVSFVKALTPSQTTALAEFMKLHPEINHLQVGLNFRGINDNSKIPFGTCAHLESANQLPWSLLPENMSHITALFAINEDYSELNFLRRTDLEEKTQLFHRKLGDGPITSDIAFKNNVLPSSLGKDLKNWVPFLGKGFLSIIPDPKTSEDRQRYFLAVSIPELPVVALLYKEALAEREIPTAGALSEHPVVGISKELTLRNACKVAHEFCSTMGIELIHRRPNILDKRDNIGLPVPECVSMNPGPIYDPDDQFVKIASGLVSSRNNPSACRRGVYTAGAAHGFMISSQCSRLLVPFGAAKTGMTVTVGKEIGHNFLTERVFCGSKDRSPTTLHPRISKVKNNKELEEFITRSLQKGVMASKSKVLFLHK